MTFSVGLTRFSFDAGNMPRVPPGEETNLFRGSFGAALRKTDPALYARWFDPHWTNGPSGYKNAPRPFVLRWREPQLHFITFDPHPTPRPIEVALAQNAAIKREAVLQLPVLQTTAQTQTDPSTLRLNFVTPVELKKDGQIVTEPEFSILIDRLVERVWALGCLYQHWPASTDLTPLSEAARKVQLVGHGWEPVVHQRRSARSCQLHGIGGFTGWAEYAGPLHQFLPLLAIGAWTGVGRQTVWGKGAFQLQA